MSRKWIVMLAAALVLCTTAARAAEEAVKVEVRGIRIVGEAYGEGFGGLRPFNWNKGTTVAILVEVPEGGVIAFDKKSSKLATFTDGKGADLLKATRSRFGFGQGPFGSRAEVSKDGKACLVEVTSGQVPGKGAAGVVIKGTLAFQRGTGKKTFKHANVALKVGTKVRAGDIPFKITKAGEPQWKMGNAKFEISLKATQDITKIAAIRFLDATGKEIKTRSSGSSSSRGLGKVEIERSFSFPEKLARVTVAIDYWQNMKTVKVPFSIDTGMGVGGATGTVSTRTVTTGDAAAVAPASKDARAGMMKYNLAMFQKSSNNKAKAVELLREALKLLPPDHTYAKRAKDELAALTAKK